MMYYASKLLQWIFNISNQSDWISKSGGSRSRSKLP